jgi:hypothetical protein
MKTRTIVSVLILVLAVLVIVGSCATRKIAISIEDAAEILSGKWVNETFMDEQLAVFYSDGRFEIYDTPQQLRLVFSGTSNIYESWRDSAGVLWYKARWKDSLGQEGYVLGKISNMDNTLEFLYTAGNVEIEEWLRNKGYDYIIRYRQE